MSFFSLNEVVKEQQAVRRHQYWLSLMKDRDDLQAIIKDMREGPHESLERATQLVRSRKNKQKMIDIKQKLI